MAIDLSLIGKELPPTERSWTSTDTLLISTRELNQEPETHLLGMLIFKACCVFLPFGNPHASVHADGTMIVALNHQPFVIRRRKQAPQWDSHAMVTPL